MPLSIFIEEEIRHDFMRNYRRYFIKVVDDMGLTRTDLVGHFFVSINTFSFKDDNRNPYDLVYMWPSSDLVAFLCFVADKLDF